MKKLFTFTLMLLLCYNAEAQRRRLLQIDADLTTLPDAGRYGLGVKKKQPYLISSDAEYWRIRTEPVWIPAQAIGSSRIDTLDFSSSLVVVYFDSTEITLPIDSIPDNWYYHFLYQGIDKDTVDFVNIDDASIIYFSDTIWVYGDQTNVWEASNYLGSNHPNKLFQLKNFSTFQLFHLKQFNKWLLYRKEDSEFSY